MNECATFQLVAVAWLFLASQVSFLPLKSLLMIIAAANMGRAIGVAIKEFIQK